MELLGIALLMFIPAFTPLIVLVMDTLAYRIYKFLNIY
jgi:hypothetical protein